MNDKVRIKKEKGAIAGTEYVAYLVFEDGSEEFFSEYRTKKDAIEDAKSFGFEVVK